MTSFLPVNLSLMVQTAFPSMYFYASPKYRFAGDLREAWEIGAQRYADASLQKTGLDRKVASLCGAEVRLRH